MNVQKKVKMTKTLKSLLIGLGLVPSAESIKMASSSSDSKEGTNTMPHASFLQMNQQTMDTLNSFFEGWGCRGKSTAGLQEQETDLTNLPQADGTQNSFLTHKENGLRILSESKKAGNGPRKMPEKNIKLAMKTLGSEDNVINDNVEDGDSQSYDFSQEEPENRIHDEDKQNQFGAPSKGPELPKTDDNVIQDEAITHLESQQKKQHQSLLKPTSSGGWTGKTQVLPWAINVNTGAFVKK